MAVNEGERGEDVVTFSVEALGQKDGILVGEVIKAVQHDLLLVCVEWALERTRG